jgi:isochorismate synthase
MVGAIPFDTSEPSELFIPASWTAFSRTEKQHSARYASGQQPMDVVQRREIPEQDTFMAMVARAAALTATPEVDKVVLSRLIDITTRERVIAGRCSSA